MEIRTVLRRSTLVVSLRVHARDPAKTHELCAGTEVEVTDFTDGDETLCLLRDGREVWIERRYLV